MNLEQLPKTLKETHEFLDKYLQDKDVFKDCPEEDVIGTSHMFLGRWLRNKWALWWSPELYERVKANTPEGQEVDYPVEKPELVQWFNDLGIEYADDMSGIVIISYHKYLNNKPYDLDEDVRAIKEFYEKDQGDNDITQSMKNEQE